MMDRNKRELETLVSSQKEQLIRYEKRLKGKNDKIENMQQML